MPRAIAVFSASISRLLAHQSHRLWTILYFRWEVYKNSQCL